MNTLKPSSKISALSGYSLGLTVLAVTAGLWFFGKAPETAAALSTGSLIKASMPAVYFYHSDGKRYVFPDEKTYFTWYADFGGVQTISDGALAAIPIGGNVLYRPGTKLIKVTTDPKVYAVGEEGRLRWVASEQAAIALFGPGWAKSVNDLSDAFFVNYPQGQAIYGSSDYPTQTLLNTYRSYSDILNKTGLVTAPQTPSTGITGPAIHVSLAGNDQSGDGTSAKPVRTIGKALELAEPGTTIALAPGTYDQSEVRIRNPRITLTSSGATRAVIKAPLPSSVNDGDSAVMVDVDADQTVLRNLEIQGGFYGISLETKWDWGEADRSGVSDVTIEDCIIHDTGRDAIKVKPNVDRVTIRRNEIYNTGLSQSPDDCNAEGIDNVNGDDLLVDGNHIHNVCSNGVYCKGGARNCRITNNRFSQTGSAAILVGFDTSPEYFDLAVNPDYYESLGAVVRNNLILDAGGSGIGLYASKDALIENNTVIDAGKKFHAPLYFGVTYQDWEPQAKRPANVNPTVRNNVFVQSAAGQGNLLAQIRYSDDLGGLSGLQGQAHLSNNCYFNANGAAEFSDRRPGQEFEGGFAGWAAHMLESGSVETNPSFDSNKIPTATACASRGWRP